MEAVRASDNDAAKELITSRYFGGYAYSRLRVSGFSDEDVVDATHRTVEKFRRRLKPFTPSENQEVRALFYVSIRHALLSQLKRENRLREVVEGLMKTSPPWLNLIADLGVGDENADPSLNAQAAELCELIGEIISEIDPSNRMRFVAEVDLGAAKLPFEKLPVPAKDVAAALREVGFAENMTATYVAKLRTDFRTHVKNHPRFQAYLGKSDDLTDPPTPPSPKKQLSTEQSAQVSTVLEQLLESLVQHAANLSTLKRVASLRRRMTQVRVHDHLHVSDCFQSPFLIKRYREPSLCREFAASFRRLSQRYFSEANWKDTARERVPRVSHYGRFLSAPISNRSGTTPARSGIVSTRGQAVSRIMQSVKLYARGRARSAEIIYRMSFTGARFVRRLPLHSGINRIRADRALRKSASIGTSRLVRGPHRDTPDPISTRAVITSGHAILIINGEQAVSRFIKRIKLHERARARAAGLVRAMSFTGLRFIRRVPFYSESTRARAGESLWISVSIGTHLLVRGSHRNPIRMLSDRRPKNSATTILQMKIAQNHTRSPMNAYDGQGLEQTVTCPDQVLCIPITDPKLSRLTPEERVISDVDFLREERVESYAEQYLENHRDEVDDALARVAERVRCHKTINLN